MQFPAVTNDPFEPARPVADPAAERRSFDLHEIWAAVYRSRYWIGGIFALCIAGAIVFTLLATRYYSSTAAVEVRQEAEKVLGTEADKESASSRLDSDRFLQSQLDIIRSRSVATSVAENLGLFRGDAFLEAMHADETKESRILSPQEAHRENVLATMADNLSVRYTGDTRIAAINFTSPDPRLAARIANGYADSFIRTSLERRANSSSYALDFLRNQLAESQGNLEKSEQAALDYARQTRIVDASNAANNGAAPQPQSLVTAQLVQLNQAYSTAVADRIEAEQKWTRTASLPLLSIPDVLSNQAVQTMLARRAQLQADLREQQATRQDDYPAVREAQAQVTQLDAAVSGLARDIRQSIRSQYDVAQQRQRQIEGQLDRLKNSTLSEQNQTIQLSILRREADTNRQQYDALLKRYNALNAESGVQTNNLTVIDRADVADKPSWPRLPITLAVALALACLLSAGTVAAREQLFDAIRTPHDVTDRLGLALLGAIPVTEDTASAVVDPKSAITEAYGSVRTSLSLSTGNGPPRAVMFTSAQASEGKSSACHALARSFARLGKRSVIVDVDLRRPNAHRLFDLPNRNGVSNVLAGQVSLAEAIRPSGIDNIDLLPAGEIPPNPSELIAGPALAALFDELAQRYDLLLVDSAPVLGLADAVVLASEVQATIFVIEAGRNSVRGAQQAVSRLNAAGGNVVGAILTKFDPGKLGYGYGTDYRYNYRYDYADRRGD